MPIGEDTTTPLTLHHDLALMLRNGTREAAAHRQDVFQRLHVEQRATLIRPCGLHFPVQVVALPNHVPHKARMETNGGRHRGNDSDESYVNAIESKAHWDVHPLLFIQQEVVVDAGGAVHAAVGVRTNRPAHRAIADTGGEVTGT